MGKRVLVCGGRNYNDTRRIFDTLDEHDIEVLIHGKCPTGADHWADEWAKKNGVKVEAYPADWNRYKIAAGPIRNGQMLRVGKPDYVIAFPGGTDTADMVDRAEEQGMRVFYIDWVRKHRK